MEKVILKLPYSFRRFAILGSEKDGSIMNEIKVTKGYYEPFLMSFFSKLVKKNWICFDIGANIGTISLCLGHLASRGKVYAFEASGYNFEYLQNNISNNQMQNVVPIHLGIYNEECTMEVQFIEEFAGGAFMNTTGVADTRSQFEKIHCVSLDMWVEEQMIAQLDLIKMDIEGAEVKAIEGAKKTIEKFQPDFVVEYNEVTLERFFGERSDKFYELLKQIYPHVYLISRDKGKLIKLESYKELHEIALSHGRVDNLYCTFRSI